jgi:ABC-2 type transport system ATP-binding protein
MLEVSGLRKAYGNEVAVDGVSFTAGKGETVGLLGPNGAGKTTIVSIIVGLLRPDAGTVCIAGRTIRTDTDPAKRCIGLVPQDLGLFEQLSALDNLRLFGALYGMAGADLKRAVEQAIDLVGLTERVKDRVKDFSGGMKRRLNLAAALLHDPQLLLLDEPTVGVDPQSRNAIFENLEFLKKRGKTILYTTHYMEEAERLCDRLVIIDHGKIIADDTLQGLHRFAPARNLLTVEFEHGGRNGLSMDDLRQLPGVESAEWRNGAVQIGVRDLASDSAGILEWLAERGHRLQHLRSEKTNLETVFLTLTGRSLRD